MTVNERVKFWKSRRRTIFGRGVLAAAVALLIGLIGCGPKTNDSAAGNPATPVATPTVSATPTAAMPVPSPAASPSPSATPLNITAVIQDFDATMLDASGKTVARIKAASAGIEPNNLQNMMTVNQATATLYENGIATATLTAAKIVADKQKRTLTATGNVIVNSLTEKSAPTVRADKMIWRHDENKLYGSGNVIVTLKPDFTMPGKTFVADTKLSKFSVQGDGRPATGSF